MWFRSRVAGIETESIAPMRSHELFSIDSRIVYFSIIYLVTEL